MSGEARAWIGRIRDVEREQAAVRFSLARLLSQSTDEPGITEGLFVRGELVAAEAHVEGTYVVRLFSEFESALREFLRTFRIKPPRTTQALVDRVRARCRIPQDESDAVHRVREHRNALVHDRAGDDAVPVTIREATRATCTFLSRTQQIW